MWRSSPLLFFFLRAWQKGPFLLLCLDGVGGGLWRLHTYRFVDLGTRFCFAAIALFPIKANIERDLPTSVVPPPPYLSKNDALQRPPSIGPVHTLNIRAHRHPSIEKAKEGLQNGF
jgi:hypothetical protein